MSDVILVLRITPRATEPSTVSVFLSVVKCGRVCRAQTCANSAIERPTLAKGVSTGWAKKFEKISNISPKIEAYKQRMEKKLYHSPIQLSHVFGPIGHGFLQGEPKSE